MKNPLIISAVALSIGLTSCQTSDNSNKSSLELLVSSKKDSSIRDFIPKNSKIIALSSVDLNDDKKTDYIIVTESLNSINQSLESASEESQIISQKKLIVLFQITKGNFSKQIETSTIFGTSNWGIQGSDAFFGVKKEKNSFWMRFIAGGSAHYSYEYRFKYIDNSFKLIEVKGDFESFTSIDLIKGIKKNFVPEIVNDSEDTDTLLNSDSISKQQLVTINKIKVKPLYELSNFSAQNNEFYLSE